MTAMCLIEYVTGNQQKVITVLTFNQKKLKKILDRQRKNVNHDKDLEINRKNKTIE